MTSDEGNDVVEIQPDKDGKYPESVPWKQYVGTKESLGKKIDAEKANTESEKQKVISLEEKLKGATSADEFEKTKTELAELKVANQGSLDKLKGIQEKSLSEKRSALIKKGLSEEKIKDMSEESLTATLEVLEGFKPLPDLSGGSGGSAIPKGKPMELARQAYANSK